MVVDAELFCVGFVGGDLVLYFYVYLNAVFESVRVVYCDFSFF